MRYLVRWSTAWSTVLATTLLFGCREETPKPPPSPPVAEKPDEVVPEVPPAKEAPPEPAPPPTIPEVAMTQAMAATNVVKVGDSMPEGELRNLEGNIQPLEDSYGHKLTVVLFWNSENLYALQELQDLQLDVFEPYQPRGVQVIGINVGDAPEVAKQEVEQAGVTYPQFLDSDRSYFARVATEHLPRTYLLNADGEILWFDLEYSATTRRNLQQAIEVALAKSNEAELPLPAEPSAGSPEAKP